jgi:hypothetical protein
MGLMARKTNLKCTPDSPEIGALSGYRREIVINKLSLIVKLA